MSQEEIDGSSSIVVTGVESPQIYGGGDTQPDMSAAAASAPEHAASQPPVDDNDGDDIDFVE